METTLSFAAYCIFTVTIGPTHKSVSESFGESSLNPTRISVLGEMTTRFRVVKVLNLPTSPRGNVKKAMFRFLLHALWKKYDRLRKCRCSGMSIN